MTGSKVQGEPTILRVRVTIKIDVGLLEEYIFKV